MGTIALDSEGLTFSVSSVKCDSGKCISEKHLPGVIVHETSGVSGPPSSSPT